MALENSDKFERYFSSIRWDIIDCVLRGGNRVFEVGCGTGATLNKLKELGKASEIVGLDINRDAIESGKFKLDKALGGDIETFEIPYPERYFDYIICADVLEHLKDPWKAVAKLKKFLKGKGLLIASIPNARHIRVVYSLAIRGDFKYSDVGIMDITHLRFFCRKNILELLNSGGFNIVEMRQTLGRKADIINKLTLNLFRDFLITQYIVIARAKNG